MQNIDIEPLQALRVCRVCGVEALSEEDLENFVKHSVAPFGRRKLCKVCSSDASRKYNKDNRETILLQKKQYYADNLANIKNSEKTYRETNKSKIASKHKVYREANKAKLAEYMKQYRKENRDRISSLNARRRAARLDLSPTLSKEENYAITEIYQTAKLKSSSEHTIYHVDHIIPLSRGGIHHPANLQVITAKDNLEKKDKMPTQITELNMMHHAEFYGVSLEAFELQLLAM